MATLSYCNLVCRRVTLHAMKSARTPSSHKRTHGQFFTHGNPFVFKAFASWFERIPLQDRQTILEPFAGANHIVKLMNEAGFTAQWACFDIDPPSPMSEGFEVVKRNTLSRFPSGFKVVVTNPPYLARNSAARRGLPFPKTQMDDVYKHALQVALKKVPYVAAIIPESFIASGEFVDRLEATISLTSRMFQDTDHPVCLALFSPSAIKQDPDDFSMWDGSVYLGRYRKFEGVLAPVSPDHRHPWKFNDPCGSIGLRGVDDTKSASICFVPGSTIDPQDVKHSSRAVSRISGLPEDVDVDVFVSSLNVALASYRNKTHDALMTSFKGLRADGKYRRRLDFSAARNLMDHELMKITKS